MQLAELLGMTWAQVTEMSYAEYILWLAEFELRAWEKDQEG